MATETAISDHTSAADEQVEKKVNEEVKSIEEEKPKVEESPSPVTATSKLEEVSVDKQIGPPIVEDEKTDGAPVSAENITEEKDFIPDSHTLAVPEPVADTMKTQPAIEAAVKEAPEQVAIAFLEKGPEEKPEVVDVPEPIAEAPEKLLETLDVLPAKESEAVGIEEIKNLDVKSIKVEKPEAAALEAEERLGEEQSELNKKVEKVYEEVETKESVETDSEKDTGTSAEKVENSSLLKEVQTDEEEKASAIRSSEQAPTNQEAQTDLKEDGIDFSLPITVTEKVDAEDKKELSGADVVGDQLSKEALVETGKIAEENVATIEENEEGSVKINEIPEESTLPVKEEDVDSSISTVEVNEKSLEGENTDTDVEVAIEENKGEQNVKDDILALAETKKDEHVEEKQAEVTTVVSKPLKEAQESELEVSEETVETGEDKVEKGNFDEIEKSDAHNLKPSVNESELEVRSEETVETGEDKVEKGNFDEIAKSDAHNLKPSVNESELEVRSEETVETGEDKVEKGNFDEIAKSDAHNLKPSVNESELEVRSEETVETSEDKVEKGNFDEIAKSDAHNLEPSVNETELEVRSEETVETIEDKLEKGKADEIAKSDVQNLEPSVQESELQVRSEETVETGEDKLEKGKVDEIAKSDVQNLEPSVDVGDETKTSQNQTKELPTKSTPKQSNNIISKVKQSLVKAKKAIIGKSPSSKTLPSETKGDIKVK